jgi:hypothetical protein
LSKIQKTFVDRTFYLAVSAYSRGSYAEADRRVAAILKVEPFNRDARALRRKIRAVPK